MHGGILWGLICLARRKWLVLKATVIMTVVGLVLCFVLPVRYTASVKIMTPQQVQSSAQLLMMNALGGAGLSALASAGGGSLLLKNPNDTYVGLLESRTIADAIIQQFSLAKLYRSKDMTEARKKLASRTSVASDKSGLLVVSVTDADKWRAANMANAYIDQLRLLTKNLAVTEASQRRAFYEDQLTRAKDDLVNAEYAFRGIQQKHGVVQPDAQVRAVIGTLAALHAQIDAKQVELEALRSYSTESNPNVQIIQTQLATLRAQAQKLEVKSGPTPIGGLGLQDVAGAGMEYLRAQHEVLYRQALFDILIKQYDAAKLDEAKQGAIIQVVEPGIPPDRRSFPKRTWVVVFFSLLGLAGGCVLALVYEAVEKDPSLLQPIRDLGSALRGK